MRDVADRADLELLLRDFYTRAFADELLRHVFVDVVRMDLGQHLPVIADFWEKVLLGTGSYSGRPLDVHRHVDRRVPLTEQHFARWLELWRESLDASFAGPVAERAYVQATRMARGIRAALAEPVPPVRRALPLVSQG